ncbi:MAG TPA: hypothetical protein VFP30_03365 [Candidatus Limnocylindria bacterium]|nr:hypothetical protein [Candidatus Limnocylindria bacterium]
MVETLTESFCERCGTRYEFKAPTRLNPLRKTRGLFGGLKNYLTSQDDFGDALGDAMRSEEEQLASAQLEAFHESFNFCINCRQYTCLNCWNDDEGRCRSCAPIAGTDDLADRLAASLASDAAPATLAPADAFDATMVESDIQRRPGMEAWPSSDAVAPVTNGHASTAWPTTDDLAAGLPAEPEWDAATDPVVAEVEPEPVVAEVEPEVRPEPVVAEVEPEPEPVVAEVEPEPEPAVAEVEPEPEPVVAEPEPEPEPFVAESGSVWEYVAADAEPAWDAVAEETDPALERQPEPIAAEADSADEDPAPRTLRVVAWDEDAAYDVAPPMAAEVEPEPVVAEQEPEPEPVVAEVEPEPEPVVAEVEPEPEPVVAEVEPEPEPVVAEQEPEPVVAEQEPEPEPVVADVEPEPEPVEPPTRPRIAPISETILHFPTRAVPEAAPEPQSAEPVAAEADTPEVAARRAQLDLLGLGDPGEGTVSDRPTVLPYRSRGATPTPAELAALARGGFWEASAREVAGAAANVGVQNCGQCGLSLSATARFCRRCGTRQAQPA